MVDPINFTNFNLSKNKLEEYILFCIGAAGKNALTTARLLEELLSLKSHKSPFESIRSFHSEARLRTAMRKVGFGCHTLKARGFWWMAYSGLCLKNCNIDELEQCPGIGLKTSRFFLMHTRKDCKDIACLDVHILSYLRDLGYDAPKQTPTKKRYKELERIFLNICEKKGLLPADLDLRIWNEYRERR